MLHGFEVTMKIYKKMIPAQDFEISSELFLIIL